MIKYNDNDFVAAFNNIKNFYINNEAEYATFEGRTYLVGMDADAIWGYAGLPYNSAQDALSRLIVLLEKGEIEDGDYFHGSIPQQLEALTPLLGGKSEEEIERAMNEALRYDDIEYGYNFGSIEEMFEELEEAVKEYIKNQIYENLGYFLDD